MSLRARLMLLVALCTVPTLGIFYYDSWESSEQRITAAHQDMRARGARSAALLDAELRIAKLLLLALARLPTVSGLDNAACARLLSEIVVRSGRHSNVLVMRANGDLVCSARPAQGPVNFADRDYFKRALAAKEPVVGQPTVGRIQGFPVLPVAYAVRDAAGDVLGVLNLSVNIEQTMQIEAMKLFSLPSMHLTLWNADRTVAFRWPDAERTAGKSFADTALGEFVAANPQGHIVATGVDGVERVFGFATIAESGDLKLKLSISVPSDTVRAGPRAAFLRNVGLLAGLALLAFTLAWVLGEYWIHRRVAALTHTADRVGSGDFNVRMGAPYTRDELGHLAQSFDGMAAKLQAQLEALRKSEAELQAVFENLAEGVAVSNLDGQLLHFNRAAIEMFGFASRDEYLRRLPEFADALELSAPDGTILPVEQWPLARILRGETLRDLEMGTRHIRNGYRRIFSYGGTLARDAAGQPLLAVVTIRDITERKQAEQKIRAQLEHLSLLDQITRSTGERLDLKSIFQIVLIRLEDSLPVDFACVCLYDAAANTLRVTCVGAKSRVLAHELTLDGEATIVIDPNGLSRCVQGHLVYEPDVRQVKFPFPERLARGGLGSVVMAPLRAESRVFGVLVVARCEAQAFSSTECEFLRQLSEHVALAAHQAQLYGSLQQAYDDLRQTQAAVMQEERLRALGQMASGIAHDINNALSPVSLYVESMLETERNLSARARGYLETIQRAVEDVAQTVARMREFYRQREQQLVLTPVQMNSMVQQVVDLTRARWRDMPQSRGIVIRALTELAPELPQIMGVESEIREALTNLVFNAVDAMPEGGTLTLRTRVANADPERPAVAVEVADTGAGMDEDTRRRCLEPFFTTKGERGTGLGLAMVFGMVQRHSAEIEIDSAPGAGTTMRLVFAVPAAVQADTGQPAALQVPSRLRLLLIDDDPVLLKSLQDTLQTDGHVIVTANGGEAGIAAFRAALGRGETFAAVITDLGMPYVDGRQVAAAVKEASPATPVILLTGWGQRLIADNDIPPHVDRVLAKPPKLRELREALALLCQAAVPEPIA